MNWSSTWVDREGCSKEFVERADRFSRPHFGTKIKFVGMFWDMNQPGDYYLDFASDDMLEYKTVKYDKQLNTLTLIGETKND